MHLLRIAIGLVALLVSLAAAYEPIDVIAPSDRRRYTRFVNSMTAARQHSRMRLSDNGNTIIARVYSSPAQGGYFKFSRTFAASTEAYSTFELLRFRPIVIGYV